MEVGRFLIVAETVFCDVEKDPVALDLYFKRLKLCLQATKYLSTKNLSYHHALYVSNDKKNYRDKIENFIVEKNIEHVKIYGYDHPETGYGASENSHIDLIKNPSRTAKYRNKLFDAVDVDYSSYDYFIRIAIDDDDVWLNDHFQNIKSIAEYLSLIVEKDSVVGIGINSTYIASLNEEGTISVDAVELDRAVCGNKFYFSGDWEKIKSWSPWSIPDSFSTENINKFKNNYGINLYEISNVKPGFVYFRRGVNLSNQSKGWCTRKFISKKLLNSEVEVIQKLSCSYSPEKVPVMINSNDDSFFFVCYEKNNSRINYEVKLKGDTHSRKTEFAFYLYQDGKFLKKMSYSEKESGYFDINDLDKVYQVVCFIKSGSTFPIRIKSSKVKNVK